MSQIQKLSPKAAWRGVCKRFPDYAGIDDFVLAATPTFGAVG
ncbi:MAG TPA: hypothetical protein VGJ20_08480 [Xanthobacteraceae bacterium]